MTKLLETIDSPADLRRLRPDDLARLASEIRSYILEVVSKNGGHLSANLGVVELTLALHYVFDTPADKIIWDVGHQCYTHKIVTGRREAFRSLRQNGGLLGFPAREESPYDVYNTGHASTALSAALGMAVARDMRGEDFKIIAVVGDGGMTGGVAWEALNQVGHLRPNKLILVLNDNEMSISPSVGALSRYLGYLATGQYYLRAKDRAKTLLKGIPRLGWPIIRAGRAVEEAFKKTFFPGLVFEELGLRYVGPVEGHSLPSLIEVFRDARLRGDGPTLIHCVTRKGRGYVPAQESPDHYHGASPFDVPTGEPKAAPRRPTYSCAFGEALLEIARRDPKVLAITAAMPEGTGLLEFARELPDRFFDVGIAEQHAVNFAAGLAISGYKPVCAIYSTFLQRAYDQIYHDVCLQNLPVVLALDRAGVVPDDGPTHQGINDIAFLRPMPNIVLMAPRDEVELKRMLEAALGYGRPVAIRYPKSEIVGLPAAAEAEPVPLGKAEILKDGRDLLFAYGSLVYPALEAARILESEGISLAVADAKFAKPLDEGLILRFARAGRGDADGEAGGAGRPGGPVEGPRRIVTAEEGVAAGGFGSEVRELLAREGLFDVPVKCIGLPSEVYPLGKTAQIKRWFRLDAQGLAEQIREFYRSLRSS